MTINWTQLYLDTHQFSEGAITIASSFVGNVLAVKAQTKPEYATTRQIIGYIYQQSGSARKGYALYSGDDVLLLAVPETSSLTFFPTSFLSDSYTLEIAYTAVGNILEPNTAPIPDDILALVSRVNNLESNAIAPAWDNITGKPESFPPSSHNHAISEVTGLSDALSGKSNTAHTHAIADISYLSETLSNLASEAMTLKGRVATLEAASPASGASFNYTSLSADTILESDKSYLATVSGLTSTLPSTPAIGDVIDAATGNFDLKVFQNTSQQILNLNTQTVAGTGNGIILKPYSSIQLIYIRSGLWVSGFRARTINNWQVPTESLDNPVLQTYTASPLNSYSYADNGGELNATRLYDGDLNRGLYVTGSPTNSAEVIVTLPSAKKLLSFDYWNGFNGSNPLATRIRVYSGNSINPTNLLKEFFPSAQNGNVALDAIVESDTYLFSFYNSASSAVAISELKLYVAGLLGGEVTAT